MILKLGSRKGSVFTMLMGTVAMVGIVSVAAMNLIGGPITTAAKVTHQNMAQNDLLMNAKVVVMSASTRPQMGDEDGDGYVEPVPFVPTSETSCNITLPAEGGCLPSDIGAIQADPWGTQYAYCVWDHGDVTGSANRIDGEDNTSGAVLAIISAGPNKWFETPCLPYDGDPVTADTAIDANGLGDDLVQIFTYAGAVVGSGGLWELKENEPTTASIAKDIEVDGAFRMGFAGENEGEVGTSACTQGSHIGRMRFNPFDKAIEVCAHEGGSYEWETLAVAGGSVPVGTISAFNGTACPVNWQAVSELQGRVIMGAGNGYTVGQTGGAATVTLTEAQLPSHSHVVDPPNTATTVAGAHNHTLTMHLDRSSGNAGNAVFGDEPYYGTGNFPTSTNGNHAHTVDVAPFWSNAMGGGQAHENRPPYRVYLFCMYLGGGDGAVAKSFNDLQDVDTTGAQDHDVLVWNEAVGQWRPEGQWVKENNNLTYKGGHVGIGTDNPKNSVHVEGENSLKSGILTSNPSNGTGGTQVWVRTDGGIALMRPVDSTAPSVNGYIDFSAKPLEYPQGKYARIDYDASSNALRFYGQDVPIDGSPSTKMKVDAVFEGKVTANGLDVNDGFIRATPECREVLGAGSYGASLANCASDEYVLNGGGWCASGTDDYIHQNTVEWANNRWVVDCYRVDRSGDAFAYARAVCCKR